jgi:hypothetical protein
LSKVQVDTIDTRSGTSTMQIGSTNTTTINLGVSGDTVNIPSGVTIANAGTATGFGESNTPAFRATAASGTTVAHDTATKVAFTTEVFDVGSGYDASNSKFVVPSGEAGKYFFAASIEYNITTATTSARAQIRKNGSIVIAIQGYNSYYDNNIVCGVVDLAVNDYIEVYGYQNSSGSTVTQTGAGTNYFVGFKVTS